MKPLKFEHLTPAQREALSVIGRDPQLIGAVTGILDKFHEVDSKNYERAKESLVITGANRDMCLQLRGQLLVLNELRNLFNDVRSV